MPGDCQGCSTVTVTGLVTVDAQHNPTGTRHLRLPEVVTWHTHQLWVLNDQQTFAACQYSMWTWRNRLELNTILSHMIVCQDHADHNHMLLQQSQLF